MGLASVVGVPECEVGVAASVLGSEREAAACSLARIAAVVLGVALAAGGGAASGSDSEHPHHHGGGAPEATPELRRTPASYTVPDVALVDATGRPVRLAELLDTGDPVLLNFVFTTCTAICPVMSGIFEQVQRELGSERVRMVSVSIDPEHDTPRALAAYAARFHAGAQWHLLTGTLEDSIAVQKAFDAYRGDKGSHVPLTLVRRAPGPTWVRFEGFASAGDLVREIRGASR